MAPHGRIVVGVDGSESAQQALQWALHQAKLTGAVVVPVTAWGVPLYYGMSPSLDVDMSGPARKTSDAAIEQAVETVGTGVPIEPHIVHGHAATALLNAALDADLLVVGTRGHAGFTEALLGSVAQRCTHFATCPVVVVPARMD